VFSIQLADSLPKGFDHDQRLRIARELCDLCLQQHGEKIAAIGIYGSTAIGLDDPYSDLDMTVVCRADLAAESKCYSHLGLPINLDYQSIDDCLEEANDPVEGGCWIDFLVLHDPENIVETFRETFRHLGPPDYLKHLERKVQDDLTTLIGKIRNAVLSGDRAAFIRSTQDFGEEICRALLLINETHSTGCARLLSHTKNLPIKPERFDENIDILLGARLADNQRIYTSAEALWDQVREMASKRGVQVNCEQLVP